MADAIRKLRNEIDGYTDTVWFVLALIHELAWDDAKKQLVPVSHLHGKNHLAHKSGEESNEVTPDLAMILPQKVGVTGDAKISFGGTQNKDGIRDQMLKYDGVLSEWRTQGIVDEGCVVLLTHYTRKANAQEYFEKEITDGRFSRSRSDRHIV